MIFDGLEFHNVGELRKIDGRAGLLMQRIPECVRSLIRPPAQERYKRPAGVQIRFSCSTFPIKIMLYNYGEEDKAVVCFGDFQHEEIIINRGLFELTISVPDGFRQAIPHIKNYRYAPEIIRIIFYGLYGELHYLSISDRIASPPERHQLPSLRYLAYGTSITHGLKATSPLLTFVELASERLGADLINLGTGASAFCEEALAQWISKRGDWDFATLCISVNMLNQGISAREFYNSAKCFVNTIACTNQKKPIFCISILPYFMDILTDLHKNTLKSSPDEYRKVLCTIVEELGMPNLYYIDGKDLMDNFRGLSSDLIHPGNNGMIRISEKLSNRIFEIIGKRDKQTNGGISDDK